MIFKTAGDKSKPAILFFHAMGVTGDSSMPVAECLETEILLHLCRLRQYIVPDKNIAVKQMKYSR